jgi:hypothetical protein
VCVRPRRGYDSYRMSTGPNVEVSFWAVDDPKPRRARRSIKVGGWGSPPTKPPAKPEVGKVCLLNLTGNCEIDEVRHVL